MWDCPKPPNGWQYHLWAAHPLACRLPLIILVPMTRERKKLRMLNKGVARPCAGQWQGIPLLGAPALPVNQLTVNHMMSVNVKTCRNVCDTEPPANQLNLDWMKVPTVQKRVECALTSAAKGLYSQPFGSEEEMLLVWVVHSGQGLSAICHPL